MTEVSAWSQTDANNNSAAPAGAPELMLPGGLNDTLRAVQGAAARRYARGDTPTTTAGTSTAYTVAYTVAPSAYSAGETFLIEFNAACGASPTLNINGLGALPLHKYTAGAWGVLAANDVLANTVALVSYNLGAGSLRIIASSTSFDLNILGLTAETAPATGDSIALYDLSATANRKMTLANLLTIINTLTEDTSPDGTADFIPVYDTSGTAVKKTLLKRAGAWVPLTAIDLTGASAADIVLDTTNYRALWIELDAVVMTSDGANLLARVSIDAGSTFISTATYGHTRNVTDTTPANTPAGSGGDTAIVIAGAVDSTASQNLSGIVDLIIGAAAANATKLLFRAGYLPTGAIPSHSGGYGSNATASQVNAIRFLPSTSTFASGFIRPYAILK